MKALTTILVLALTSVLSAQTVRHSAVAHHFEALTGYPHGRPGYVIDHIIPLCGGGPDTVWNLQWQTIAEAKAKDIVEKQECAKVRANQKRWPKG